MREKNLSELNMKLAYHESIADQDINIDELRPKGSYDNLIAKRNYSLKSFLNEKGFIEDKYLVVRECPSCGCKEYQQEYAKDCFNLVSCKECALVYVNPILKPQVYEDIYRDGEYINIVKKLGEESHDYRRKRFGVERVDDIEKFVSAELPKKVLEIGASTGFMLQAAKTRGWEVCGIELNPSAVAFARQKEIRMFDQPLKEIDFGDEKFSVVAMYDIIEHLTYPAQMMRQVESLLLENGLICVYVPNYQSASRHLLGVENAHFIWPTHHLNYFTPLTLKFFLEKMGFEVLHWETQGLDIEDWLWYLKEKTGDDCKLIEEHRSFFQFVINSSGYGKNLRMYAKRRKNHA